MEGQAEFFRVGQTITLLVETVETTIMDGMGNTNKLMKAFAQNFTKSCISIKSKFDCSAPYLTKYVIQQHHGGNRRFSETSRNTGNTGLCVTQYSVKPHIT